MFILINNNRISQRSLYTLISVSLILSTSSFIFVSFPLFINSPSYSQVVGSSAPSYDLSITGLYESIWYTFDGGLTNYTASGLTGTLNQPAWSALSDGIITIDFYANNSAGMLGTAQVQVFKDSSVVEPPPPAIPGYELGILAVILIGFVLIKLKSLKKKLK